MRRTPNQADNAAARASLRRPEKLWLHYCFALVIVMCLILITFFLNRAMVERGLLAAEAVKRSNEQIQIVQDIVSASDVLAGDSAPSFTRFDKAVARLESVHGGVLSTTVSSDMLSEHYFGTARPLHLRVQEFLGVAKRFSSASPELRKSLSRRLNRLFESGGLQADLLETAAVVVAQFEADAAVFSIQQRAMLVASGLVLLAEAFFIFLPAQRTVQSNLQAMRQTANDLRTSQTKLETMNHRLEHMVGHDQLTGLPNRRSLIENLDSAIADGRTEAWSLLLVGLDDFKSVNDMIGHDYGDALLIAVSQALRNCVDDENLVAHVGGDAFVLISSEPARYLVPRIMASLRDPFAIKGRRIPINASIGYLEIGEDANQPLDILANAEIALKFAKSTGGNRAQAFTQDLRDDLSMMKQLQLDLSDAIQNGEIEPWFQPQVRLSDGRLHGAEVLARWRHPTRGLLTPDAFLPAAERAGLMIDLDHAIWRSAMDQARAWQVSDIWRPTISLNAAPDTIADPNLLERFLLSLQRSGLEADQVIVEVLETTLINGKDDIAAINIDSLADCGIALELDDFGTGYASLSKLTQLPLAGIKLDRSLVTPLPDQAADSVVRAILALAAELGLHVVAEGVEENEQAVHLSSRGCRIGQGYGFGKPMPGSVFTSWLAANAATRLQIGADMARFA